jgi:hypothetical protein
MFFKSLTLEVAISLHVSCVEIMALKYHKVSKINAAKQPLVTDSPALGTRLPEEDPFV